MGVSPEGPSQSAADPKASAPDLLVVADHHGARVFHVDVAADEASEHVIRPYDPHHFLHNLTHKDQSREKGQRAPEEPAYYAKIADALALGGRLVVIGHGTGKSNAAHHLADICGRIGTRRINESFASLSPIYLISPTPSF
jgi:hypothetical protein